MNNSPEVTTKLIKNPVSAVFIRLSYRERNALRIDGFDTSTVMDVGGMCAEPVGID